MRRLRLISDDPNIDFFKPMRFWLAVSIARRAADARSLLPIRGLNYGVDFLGGTLILAEFPEHRDVGEYREALERARARRGGGDRGLGRLRRAGGADAARQRRRRPPTTQAEVVPKVQEALNAAFPGVQLPAGRQRRRQGLGRAGLDRRARRGPRAPRDHGLRLAALRVAVRARRRGLAPARRDRDGRGLLAAAARSST